MKQISLCHLNVKELLVKASFMGHRRPRQQSPKLTPIFLSLIYYSPDARVLPQLLLCDNIKVTTSNFRIMGPFSLACPKCHGF